MNARRVGRAVMLFAAAAWCAACGPPPALTIRFIGNAAFELTDGRSTPLVDFPYESGGGYMSFDSAAVRPRGDVLALFTHRHRDHFDRARCSPAAGARGAPPRCSPCFPWTGSTPGRTPSRSGRFG